MARRGQSKYHIGQKIHNVTLIEIYTGTRPLKYKVLCDCGTTYDVIASNLISGKSKNCLKCQAKKISEKRFAKLTGEKYGKLVVIEKIEKKWKCQCECGNIVYRSTRSLNSTKKSGCISYCGKCRTKKDKPKKPKEIQKREKIGKRIRRFRIIDVEKIEYTGRKRLCYKCKCKCGNIFTARVDSIELYHSCGCYLKENNTKKRAGKKTTPADRENMHHLWKHAGYKKKEISEIYNLSYAYVAFIIKNIQESNNE